MRRVLVIEDHPSNRKLIRDLLRLQGYEVMEAEDADRGLELALEVAPDLIVMDIQLPGTDGLTATRLIKNDSRTRAVPVLALTAHAMLGDEERILTAGCDAYLAKPLRYRQFLDLVERLLNGSGPP